MSSFLTSFMLQTRGSSRSFQGYVTMIACGSTGRKSSLYKGEVRSNRMSEF